MSIVECFTSNIHLQTYGGKGIKRILTVPTKNTLRNTQKCRIEEWFTIKAPFRTEPDTAGVSSHQYLLLRRRLIFPLSKRSLRITLLTRLTWVFWSQSLRIAQHRTLSYKRLEKQIANQFVGEELPVGVLRIRILLLIIKKWKKNKKRIVTSPSPSFPHSPGQIHMQIRESTNRERL